VGRAPAAVARGFWHAQVGWLLGQGDLTNQARLVPDLLADPAIVRISRLFALRAVWAGLVRVAVLHHVTWSINSTCHMVGTRPWAWRDRYTNVWPSRRWASRGTTCTTPTRRAPRHGVGRGHLDMTARVIRVLEGLGS
jgi:stearoyl-CoA desaturase (Delta-9 desaturase)